MAGKKQKYGSHVEEIDQKRWCWRTYIISWPWKLGMYSAWMQAQWNNYWTIKEDVWITYFCWSNWKITRLGKTHAKTAVWSYDMEGHAQKCVEQYYELANKKLNNFTKFQVLLGWSSIQAESVGELSEVCSPFVLKCLYLARIGRPDIQGSVNKLSRSVTKWTQVCDRRLERLICYMHHTNDCRQHCHVGNTTQHCRLHLFSGLWFCRRSWRLKINLRRTFVHIRKSYICSNQLDV